MNDVVKSPGAYSRPTSLAVVATIVGLLVGWPAAFDAASADDGRSLVAETERRVNSRTQRYDSVLRSVDAGGKATEKRWTYERMGALGQSRSVVRFTQPAEVRGVTLLVVNHPDRDSDQWMWTPAIERDRRIALQDRSTRIFGTDFSFEDLDERHVDHYDYRRLPDESLDGVDCWVVEARPRQGKRSQYSKSVFWIRKDHHVYARGDFWVGDSVARRLIFSAHREVQGIWTAHQWTMSDLRRGSQTTLTLDQVRYNGPVDEGRFTLEGIRR